MGPQDISASVLGPLPANPVGLLLERSSMTMKGFPVLPGFIDADDTGKIKVMAHTPKNIVTIAPEMKIAQLVVLPLSKQGRVLQKSSRVSKALYPLKQPIGYSK